VVLTLLFAPATGASAPPLDGAHTPSDVVRCVVGAYEHCARAELDGVLSADFQFDFTIYGTIYGHQWGFPISIGHRTDELSLASRLIGITSYYRSHQMKPYGAFVTRGPIEEGFDPEHADSTSQYRLLVVRDFRIHFVRPPAYPDTENLVVDYLKGLQVLHVVRGDVAVCMTGQPADSRHWYARRWFQDVDALTIQLGKLEGECGGELLASEPKGIAPLALALRAVSAPLCPTLKVICDLPSAESAELEVYDIQGRRVAQRTVSTSSPGSVLVEAGSGMRFEPGAYWVRLTQARRPPVTRLVMVAR
jgi:hypothetical protein